MSGKRGRPKKEKQIDALLAEDLLFESQKKPFNHVGYALHKDVIKIRKRFEAITRNCIQCKTVR
jgi:hypothetical protein